MSIYNNRIRVSRRPVYLGYFLQSNGIITKDYFQAQQLLRSMHPPVLWMGQPATLHFWNWRKKKTPINVTASNLITHDGFNIRGPAIVVTGVEHWTHMRAHGTEGQVRARLDHIMHTFGDAIIFRPSGRWSTHQNIYVRNENDAFAVRMAL
jgi:hypothetical protein